MSSRPSSNGSAPGVPHSPTGTPARPAPADRRSRTHRPTDVVGALIGGALAVVVLTGCTSSDSDLAAGSATTATGSAGIQDPSGPNDVDAEHPSPLPYPTDDATSSAQALDVATTAMTAFARPGIDATTWWSDLGPQLTPAAQTAYADTDPAEVPASAITGPAAAAEPAQGSASTYLATVTVPTDVGPYRVLLVREGAGAPWLVERLTPPEGLGTS